MEENANVRSEMISNCFFQINPDRRGSQESGCFKTREELREGIEHLKQKGYKTFLVFPYGEHWALSYSRNFNGMISGVFEASSVGAL